jgi:hypothetical protein
MREVEIEVEDCVGCSGYPGVSLQNSKLTIDKERG